MWERGWRDQAWAELSSPWDVIIIGGGITGAGILREAVRLGLRALLVEAKDFAYGTSSRSSKLVHGGLRYLKNAQIKLTYESVRERERLLHSGRGLITPLGFLVANFKGDAMPAWMFEAALTLYDLLAFKWGHRHYDAYDMNALCPPLLEDGLLGGFRYFDAQTDDSRLVLRVIREAVRSGGLALNYARVTDLLTRRSGQVCGVCIEDQAPDGQGRKCEVEATVVINASGAWADELRGRVGGRARLRRLRGSHLIFPADRLPLTRAISLLHPDDGRPVFVVPWEGVVLVGTTDVDHAAPLEAEPAISAAEADYLLRAVQWAFPSQELTMEAIQATFAGVRPVIGTGKKDPSRESREHVLWCENGLLTVAGGKLTTFRLMAHDALKVSCARLPGQSPRFVRKANPLDPLPADLLAGESRAAGLKGATRQRLAGRYGRDAAAVIATGESADLEEIPGTPALWAELRWAARAEAVVHLDDLLQRRVRLGLLAPHGGLPLIDRIRAGVQPELGWDDSRWEQEVLHYAKQWKQCYHLGQP